MTAWSFETTPAYEERDIVQTKNAGLWTRVTRWVGGKEANTVKGNRAFQTEKAGAHPSEGYPCRMGLVGRNP